MARWLAACITAVVAAFAWALKTVRPGHFGLCAMLVGCGAVSVELTHRTGEQESLARDVYAICDLPAAVLLPPLYSSMNTGPRGTADRARRLTAARLGRQRYRPSRAARSTRG